MHMDILSLNYNWLDNIIIFTSPTLKILFDYGMFIVFRRVGIACVQSAYLGNCMRNLLLWSLIFEVLLAMIVCVFFVFIIMSSDLDRYVVMNIQMMGLKFRMLF